MTPTRTGGIAPRSLSRQLRKRLAAGVAIAFCTLAPLGVASAETADEFVARLNREFADIYRELNAAGWTQATYITVDTQWLSARANERFLAAFSKAVEESKQFDGKPMSAASRRAIDLLRQGVSAPAPDDPVKRAELATIMAGMEAKYGEARYCKDGGKDCRDEVQLKTVLGTGERRRAHAGLQGPGRNVALGLRHAR